ncbi:ATP-dependent RecD-like DNA helicase [Anaerosacchariphilus sp. NSJ-68]|uniref:ATP-dependent RecD2 DNA helicase n=2 Tax=Lachnospiraceae TaxID=186803 RepID=A0A923LAF6_9FIRM|nr:MULTISPECIES: ATP-dependent RecD-like DNA helicase [Lachnospiraceae]MBC5658771.1 ATP-dependent RecD-like DNA helicase [Anaerosacchariphilus hominis]MBC5698960.1 ATP-dependent RecD-like DNA helicase [Roseburia difficilis]
MKLEGYVEHIIYRNTENGYSVINLVSEEEELTAVGIFPYLNEGEFLELEGDYTEHPMYGLQFQVQSYEAVAPKDALAMERYLGSGAIKGVGAALAARIVRRFGSRTFEIMEREPERLSEIKGISDRKAREIAGQMEEKRDLREAMIFLQDYGISVNLAVKIYQQYGQEIYRIIKENPYRIADDISGVGFRTADEIARRVGIREDSDFRIRSGLLYTLLNASGEGHTCLPEPVLLHRTAALLGVPEESVERHLDSLSLDRKLIRKMLPDGQGGELPFVYSAASYYAELSIAVMLYQLNLSIEASDTEVRTRLAKIEKGSGIELDGHQREAVAEAMRHGLLILTGGPGTGKTTTINAMIRYFESENLDIFLAAPTGRAAKRMTEATGCQARTIHRMLELTGGPESVGGRAMFSRNDENPLEADVIIIDEMSMVDVYLMQALLKAIVPGTRLILVGDVNQLPSVGPGSILQDMIRSEAFPVVRLTKIFRQAAESDIIVNAHRINRGEQVTLDNKSRDFFFLQRQDPNVILRVVLALVQEKMPRYVHADISDIQVLTPMRKGALGVENLNRVLQRYLNPAEKDKAEIPFGHGISSGEEGENGKGVLRVGDKVMQIRNNYQLEWEVRNRYGIAIDKGLGVFNGDMGIVRAINSFAEEVTVEFDEGRMVSYPFKQMDELELAYAITVHKSQGSEYPAVVIPLLTGPRPLMNRNLLYTAVTRARSCVTLVGDPRTFQAMVENGTEQKRYTGLCETIKSYISTQMSDL